MKLFLNSLVVIAGAGIGLTVGFALRGKPKNPEAPVAIIPVQPEPKQIGLLNQRPAVAANDDSPLATRLEQDLSGASGVTRWLYWLDALEKATPADFPRLLHLAQGNPAVMRMVEARWVAVAPRHLFDTIVAWSKGGQGPLVNELAHALFSEWPKHDPDAAIAALNEKENLRANQNWRWRVAYTLMQNDMERGLLLLSEWHVDDVGFGPSGLAAIAKWAHANPRHAAEFMLEQGNGYSFRSTIEAIGKECSATDPPGALALATSKRGELSSLLATSVLKEWAGRDPAQAANWLSGADDWTRSRLIPTFAEAWANQDAEGALSWCEANLTGSVLAQSVAGALKGASEKDIGQAAALVAGMAASAARSEGAVAVARKWFPGLSANQGVAPETVAWLASLDSDSVKSVLDQVKWGWATSDPRSMAAFLVGLSSEQVPPQAYTVTAQELARKNPADALEWASHLPEQPSITAGTAAFVEWRTSQPEAAMKWLNELPSNDARRKPCYESVIRTLAYHPQAAEQIAAMNPQERAAALNLAETMEIPVDRRARLLDALKPH